MSTGKGGGDIWDLKTYSEVGHAKTTAERLEGGGIGQPILELYLGTKAKLLTGIAPARGGPIAEKTGFEFKTDRKIMKEIEGECDIVLSRTEIYQAIRSKAEEKVTPAIDETAFNRISGEWIDAKRRTLLSKIGLRIVPVGEFLVRRHISRDYKCRVCGAVETLQHAFVRCKLPREIWELVE